MHGAGALDGSNRGKDPIWDCLGPYRFGRVQSRYDCHLSQTSISARRAIPPATSCKRSTLSGRRLLKVDMQRSAERALRADKSRLYGALLFTSSAAFAGGFIPPVDEQTIRSVICRCLRSAEGIGPLRARGRVATGVSTAVIVRQLGFKANKPFTKFGDTHQPSARKEKC